MAKYKCKNCLDNGCITWEAGGGSSTDPCPLCDAGKFYANNGVTPGHAVYRELLERATKYPELKPLADQLLASLKGE
jgi:hypothetical protein